MESDTEVPRNYGTVSQHEHHFDIIIIANGVSADAVIFAVRMNL